eukprot:8662541-Lingulodinium_polyedra.AAC.1
MAQEENNLLAASPLDQGTCPEESNPPTILNTLPLALGLAMPEQSQLCAQNLCRLNAESGPGPYLANVSGIKRGLLAHATEPIHKGPRLGWLLLLLWLYLLP